MAQQDVAAQVEPSPFAIDPSDELPVGLQLTWRLGALISTGQLARGERLPSFRRLAGLAGVNLNTVRAVYEGLEKDGLVVSRQGQGTFVADGVEAAPELEEIAAEALRRASEAGGGPPRRRGGAVGPRGGRGGGAPGAGRGSPRSRGGERGDRGAAGAAPPDRPARGRAGELRPLP